MSRPRPVPRYRLHKPSGRAVVTVRGPDGKRHDVYLGPYNSDESRREYARVVAELASSPAQVGPTPSADLTVNEVLLAFWRHAEQHYRRADGTQTNELSEYRQTFRPLRELYGHIPAVEFGPVALKAVRGKMVVLGWCRTLVNRRVGRIRRAFKWAASEQLVPVAVFRALETVGGLQKGRTGAREAEPVRPAPEEHVRAVLPFVRPHVRGMIEVQLLTGMRPGEVCNVRPCDIDTSAEVWVYHPPHHKLSHEAKLRVVAIGPRAQAVLKEFTPSDPADFYFSPRRAVAQFHAERAAARKTPRYKSHVAHDAARRAKPGRPFADRYTVTAYDRAVGRACEKAGVPHWHPNQLRHSHGTAVRRRYGLEAAQVTLGHERADVTQVYAEKNRELATKVALEMG
jgi:integrase